MPLAMPALTLNKSSRVMPGFRGTWAQCHVGLGGRACGFEERLYSKGDSEIHGLYQEPSSLYVMVVEASMRESGVGEWQADLWKSQS